MLFCCFRFGLFVCLFVRTFVVRSFDSYLLDERPCFRLGGANVTVELCLSVDQLFVDQLTFCDVSGHSQFKQRSLVAVSIAATEVV